MGVEDVAFGGDFLLDMNKNFKHEAGMVSTTWMGSAVDEAVRFEILEGALLMPTIGGM